MPSHLDWIPENTSSLTPPIDVTKILKHAIAISRDLYLSQARGTVTVVELEGLVEKLVLTLAPIRETMPGMHAFVWCYFIGGASTINDQHRVFFIERLNQVYKVTGMRNVTATITMLKQIWASPSQQNWTHSDLTLHRTLVM